MRYRPPIVQRGLTPTEANDTKERYMKINPDAKVTVEPEMGNPKLRMLVALLPLLPADQIRPQHYQTSKSWR